jgi:hypothetical protein
VKAAVAQNASAVKGRLKASGMSGKANGTSRPSAPRTLTTKARSAPKAGAKAKPATKAKPGAKAKPATKAKPGAKAKPRVKGRPRAKTKPGAKAKPGARAKPTQARTGKGAVVLLSGGNPQIAKADGDAPVQAYIAALPGWKRALGKRLDALIVRAVPSVRKAVKWNSPLYGIEGKGWFLGVHAFTHYLKLAFFRGRSLRPLPPGTSKDKHTRYLDLHEHDKLDEAQLAAWMKQAAALPGWESNRSF